MAGRKPDAGPDRSQGNGAATRNNDGKLAASLNGSLNGKLNGKLDTSPNSAASFHDASFHDAIFQGEVKRDHALDLFREDEDLRNAIQNWLDKGKLAKLAELWVKACKSNGLSSTRTATQNASPSPATPSQIPATG